MLKNIRMKSRFRKSQNKGTEKKEGISAFLFFVVQLIQLKNNLTALRG